MSLSDRQIIYLYIGLVHDRRPLTFHCARPAPCSSIHSLPVLARIARLGPTVVRPSGVPSGQRAPPNADAESRRGFALPKADPSYRLRADDPFSYIRGFPSILSSPSFRLWSVSPIRRLTNLILTLCFLESSILDHQSPDHVTCPLASPSIYSLCSQYPILELNCVT